MQILTALLASLLLHSAIHQSLSLTRRSLPSTISQLLFMMEMSQRLTFLVLRIHGSSRRRICLRSCRSVRIQQTRVLVTHIGGAKGFVESGAMGFWSWRPGEGLRGDTTELAFAVSEIYTTTLTFFLLYVYNLSITIYVPYRLNFFDPPFILSVYWTNKPIQSRSLKMNFFHS